MQQTSLAAILADQTERVLWEVRNVMDCVPDNLWERTYCGMPLWKHIYHMLHSLDLWLINPRDPGFQEPPFHAAVHSRRPWARALRVPRQGAIDGGCMFALLRAALMSVFVQRYIVEGLTVDTVTEHRAGITPPKRRFAAAHQKTPHAL